MAAWRVPFPDEVVRRLDILPGKPSLLAVWTQSGRVCFFDVATGERLVERAFGSLPAGDAHSDAGRRFLARAKAPNDSLLPVVYAAGATVYFSFDGRMRLLHAGGALTFEADGGQTPLPVAADVRLAAVALERLLGLVAAVDAAGRLHLFEKGALIGAFDLGLTLGKELHPAVAVAEGGAALFATDGQRVVVADFGGRVRRQLALNFHAASLVCSADGRLLAVGDSETGVIRVYDGVTLTPEYQQFASDLMADARRAGPAREIGVPTALGALAISNRGTLAFALAGSVCVTTVGRMRPLARD